jgi:hypothetical protein
MKRRDLMLLLLSVALPAGSKTPPRQWQSGTFKDSQNGQYEVSTPPNAGALTRAVTVFSNHSYTDYAIESERYVFVVELKGSAHVIVNAAARFATEGQTLWFIDADGKERKTKILKQTLKEPAK